MITISVCMIVKNEEKRLRACLDSLRPIADEIVIVDTGSTDSTKAIAAEYTDLIYDFPWIDDFAAARNFAFSKATKEYIYSADADEVIDADNIRLFLRVKEFLPPETEIVQMHYLNLMEENTVYSSKREHLAEGNHVRRDLATFRKALDRGMRLDKTLHSMYAKELFIAGDNDDLAVSVPFFEGSLDDPARSDDERREARCVLARAYRVGGRIADFAQLCLREALITPCAEMCAEIGRYFFDSGNYAEALCWLNDAVFETQPVISIFVQGSENLNLLADCFEKTGDPESAAKYRKMAEEWEMPETV